MKKNTQSGRYAAIWSLIRYASSYTSSLRRGLRRLKTNDLRRPGLWRIFLPARFANKNHREIHIFDQSYKESRRYAEMWRVTDLKTWYEAVAKSLPYCSKLRRDKRFSMKQSTRIIEMLFDRSTCEAPAQPKSATLNLQARAKAPNRAFARGCYTNSTRSC